MQACSTLIDKLAIDLTRSCGNTQIGRDQIGPLGYGWSFAIWQQSLAVAVDGTFFPAAAEVDDLALLIINNAAIVVTPGVFRVQLGDLGKIRDSAG